MQSNQGHYKEGVPIHGRLESNFPSFKGDEEGEKEGGKEYKMSMTPVRDTVSTKIGDKALQNGKWGGGGEIVQWLRPLPALAKCLGLHPSNVWRLTTTCNSSSKKLDASSGL